MGKRIDTKTAVQKLVDLISSSKLEKLFFLPEKSIYFISYRNEHPVVIEMSLMKSKKEIMFPSISYYSLLFVEGHWGIVNIWRPMDYPVEKTPYSFY